MQNEQVFSKNKTSRFKNKNFIFPSGREVLIQGYENRAIDLLLNTYDENDMVIMDSNIEKLIGEVWYTGEDNKPHRYFPDIFIISENKIIEVKSDWTYKLDKNKNILKQNSCLEMGFKFEFFIFNKKERLLNYLT